MVAFQYKSAVTCVLLVIGLVTAAKKDDNKNGDYMTDDDTGNLTEADSTTRRLKPPTTMPDPLVQCKRANCSHKCEFVKNIGAVCSCPDERMYLSSDKVTCRKKVCNSTDHAKVYSCGRGATCGFRWDLIQRQSMARCTCPNYIFTLTARYVFKKETRSCEKDQRYQTCDWPVKRSCNHTCKVVRKARGTGTEPQCVCRSGYSLDASGLNCVVTNPCLADGSNGGCQHKCSFNSTTFAVQCSCYGRGFTLLANNRSCMNVKCANHGCSQRCSPWTGACFCDSTHTLGPDGKTCVDIDECLTNQHNCAETCINTDGGYVCECKDPKARLSNDLKTCILETCDVIDDILHGTTTCKHGHSDLSTMKVGDYCTFTCSTGFRLNGAPSVHCTQTGYDVIPPYCSDAKEALLIGDITDSTYMRWGKHTCPTGGPSIFSGHVIGYNGSTSALGCRPSADSIYVKSTYVGDNISPVLTLAQYNYGASPIKSQDVNVNGQYVKCARCPIQGALVYVVPYTRICPKRTYKSIEVYSGYLMAASPQSYPICVDFDPEGNNSTDVLPGAPQIDFVKTDSGLFAECVVCQPTTED